MGNNRTGRAITRASYHHHDIMSVCGITTPPETRAVGDGRRRTFPGGSQRSAQRQGEGEKSTHRPLHLARPALLVSAWASSSGVMLLASGGRAARHYDGDDACLVRSMVGGDRLSAELPDEVKTSQHVRQEPGFVGLAFSPPLPCVCYRKHLWNGER